MAIVGIKSPSSPIPASAWLALGINPPTDAAELLPEYDMTLQLVAIERKLRHYAHNINSCIAFWRPFVAGNLGRLYSQNVEVESDRDDENEEILRETCICGSAINHATRVKQYEVQRKAMDSSIAVRRLVIMHNMRIYNERQRERNEALVALTENTESGSSNTETKDIKLSSNTVHEYEVEIEIVLKENSES